MENRAQVYRGSLGKGVVYYADRRAVRGSLGKVVGLGDERPIHYDAKMQPTFGEISSHIDVLLVNALGEKRVIRIPISSEVRSFYAKVPNQRAPKRKKTSRKR